MKLTYSQRCSLPAMLPARALRGRRFLVPCAAFINGQPKAAAAKPGSGRAGDDNAATRGSVPPAPVQELQGFYARKLPTNKLEGKAFGAPAGDQRVGFVATADTGQGEVLLVVPEELAITSVDAEKHPLVGPVAQQCSELVALTLWLLAERAQGPDSKYTALLATLPEATLSPILWTDADIGDRLRGSPSMQEAKNRKSAMVRQWEVLAAQHLTDGGRFPPAVFNEQAFCQAFSVVIGHATYLPSAECFSLLPLVSIMGRTGEDSGARLDFNAEQGAVVLTASRPYREGQEVLLADGRPNGELLLSTGSLHDGNPADFLLFDAALLPADRYFSMKAQILDQLGFAPKEQFPVFADRMPVQLLAYLRLSRIADPALFAKVSFEQDVVLSDLNEYEVLQLLMGDCREKIAKYGSSSEEDVKSLQNPKLSPQERLALRLVSGEKKILNSTMEAVRRRLAPIRGIPTKSGQLQDPNADFNEMFAMIEDLPNQPKKLIDGFLGWARGDYDPEWQKMQAKKKARQPPPK